MGSLVSSRISRQSEVVGTGNLGLQRDIYFTADAGGPTSLQDVAEGESDFRDPSVFSGRDLPLSCREDWYLSEPDLSVVSVS